MAVRFFTNEMLALAAAPMLSVALWGGDEVPSTAVARSAVSSPARSSVVTASATPPAPMVLPRSAVKRRRPSFLWNFFGNAGWGSGDPSGISCVDETPAGGPVAATSTERLEPLSFCYTGFAPGDKPILHIFAPGGGRIDRPGRNTGPGVWGWHLTTDEAAAAVSHPGTYRFTVTAADTATTTGLIVVRPATRPDAVFSYRPPVRPGDVVTVIAVGHRPGSPIFASLYGPARGNRLRLSADLPVVVADRNGEGTVRWTATDGIAPGRYAILVESTDGQTRDCASSTCDDFGVVR